jgi:hypothetical protein
MTLLSSGESGDPCGAPSSVAHAELISLKGDSYRLKDRDLGPRPARQSPETA